MSPADIVILILAVLVVAASVFLAIRRRKKGKSACGGDGTHCGECARCALGHCADPDFKKKG